MIVEQDRKYYLYRFSSETQEFSAVLSSATDDGTFLNKQTVDREAEELLIQRYLNSSSDFEKKKRILLSCDYSPHQRSSIQALTHYIKKTAS